VRNYFRASNHSTSGNPTRAELLPRVESLGKR
jgi:hypothetical protein